MRPGVWLRAFARQLCSPDTMQRIVDPLIADLQLEYRRAVADGRMWQARWRRISGYSAFWRTLGLCAATSAIARTRAWAIADDNAIGRTLGYSAAFILSLTMLLALMPLAAVLQRTEIHPRGLALLYIVPQAIPIAFAFGLPLGILLGLRGRPSTNRIRWSVVGLSLIGAALSFAVCAWVLPETNQAFRESLFNPPRFLARGANELSFGELSARLAALQQQDRLEETGTLLFSYHARLAASATPLIWGIFALVLSSVSRRTVLSITTLVVAGVTYIACASFIIYGRINLIPGLPLPYMIWLPNALFALMTLALWISRRSGSGAAL
jgi:lipopolysaccharide export LptBFGC system permease protein LptF